MGGGVVTTGVPPRKHSTPTSRRITSTVTTTKGLVIGTWGGGGRGLSKTPVFETIRSLLKHTWARKTGLRNLHTKRSQRRCYPVAVIQKETKNLPVCFYSPTPGFNTTSRRITSTVTTTRRWVTGIGINRIYHRYVQWQCNLPDCQRFEVQDEACQVVDIANL